MRRTLPLALLGMLLGCGLPTFEDPGDVFLADDDDDDSAAPADDDDATSDDDDDATNPDTDERHGLVWVLDRHHWEEPDLDLHTTDAGGTFVVGEDPPVVDAVSPAGLPHPRVARHPDLDPFAGEEDCQPIASTDGHPPLPPSDDVGAALHLDDEGGSASLEIPALVGGYLLGADGPVDADSFALTLDGGVDWPGSDTPAALVMPVQPTDLLPTPGNLSGAGLVALHVQWAPDDPDVEGARIEIMVVRFATVGDETAWSGLRCLADDDGTFTIDASALISAGSGDLQFAVSRAAWTDTEDAPSEGRPHLDAVGVRTAWFRATVGG